MDLIQWLMGPVDSVVAKTATLARKIETEDTGAAVIRFKSGAFGVLEVTMLTYPRNLEGSITVLGEKGTVKIGGTALNHVDTWIFDEPELCEDTEPRRACITSTHGIRTCSGRRT